MMKSKRIGKEKKEFKSFEEYEAVFYPRQNKDKMLSNEDPSLLGVILARQTINKYKHILLNK
jgi:hypothetical protein